MNFNSLIFAGMRLPCQEICTQGFYVHKLVRLLTVTIVIEPILQSMGTLGTSLWQVSDHPLQDGAIRERHFTVDDKDGFHVAYYTIWYRVL